MGPMPSRERRAPKMINPVIVGSWDDWTCGEPMAFDQMCLCYTAELEMGSAGCESFQILSDNDWELCLHPDEHDACVQKPHGLCGPDAMGHGKNWTIGLREEDKACPGAVYRIKLKVTADGFAEEVAWERLLS